MPPKRVNADKPHLWKARETQRRALQASIDAERSAAERNRLGQFATPYGLAEEIARCVARDLPADVLGLRFADPAIGSGSFFSAARPYLE